MQRLNDKKIFLNQIEKFGIRMSTKSSKSRFNVMTSKNRSIKYTTTYAITYGIKLFL